MALERPENLVDVKVGDRFVVHSRYGREMVLAVCKHVTPTRATIGSHQYTKKDASGYGGDTWNRPPTLYMPTPELLEEIGLRMMREQLSETKWKDVPEALVREFHGKLYPAKIDTTLLP